MLVAPHRTWMDPIFLALAVYPKKLGFMAKEELFKGKFANYFLRKLNAFPVNRMNLLKCLLSLIAWSILRNSFLRDCCWI